VLAQLIHPLIESQERSAELFDLHRTEVSMIDAANSLALHQFTQQFDYRKDKRTETARGGFAINDEVRVTTSQAPRPRRTAAPLASRPLVRLVLCHLLASLVTCPRRGAIRVQ
jgi:hypothetical protein